MSGNEQPEETFDAELENCVDFVRTEKKKSARAHALLINFRFAFGFWIQIGFRFLYANRHSLGDISIIIFISNFLSFSTVDRDVFMNEN